MLSGSIRIAGPVVCSAEAREPDFERAILPHLDAAYNFARWLTRDPSAAEDIVQEAVLRALRYFASCRKDNERAWFLQIVRNTYLTGRRPEKAETVAPLAGTVASAVDVTSVPDPRPDPEISLAHREQVAILEATLARLPAYLQETLVLRELEELSYKEIARITAVPVGTVMSRLSRARRALMKAGRRLQPGAAALDIACFDVLTGGTDRAEAGNISMAAPVSVLTKTP